MNPSTVIEAALALPENDRIQLVERLLETLGPETDDVDEAKARNDLDNVERRRESAQKALTEGKAAAAAELEQLNNVTTQAWAENLSAQVKAAWALIMKEWWARFAAVGTFVVSPARLPCSQISWYVSGLVACFSTSYARSMKP